MNTQLSNIAKRSKTAIIAYKIYDNWRIKRQALRGVAETLHGSTHSHRTLVESLSYINVQFEDYLQQPGLSSRSIALNAWSGS